MQFRCSVTLLFYLDWTQQKLCQARMKCRHALSKEGKKEKEGMIERKRERGRHRDFAFSGGISESNFPNWASFFLWLSSQTFSINIFLVLSDNNDSLSLTTCDNIQLFVFTSRPASFLIFSILFLSVVDMVSLSRSLSHSFTLSLPLCYPHIHFPPASVWRIATRWVMPTLRLGERQRNSDLGEQEGESRDVWDREWE